MKKKKRKTLGASYRCEDKKNPLKSSLAAAFRGSAK